MTTLYTVTVDTEEEWDWDAGWPVSELRVTNIRQLPRFQDVCSRHNAAVTYFTNQAVLDDTEASQIMCDLAPDERVEIGMHIHPWNTPPLRSNGAIQVRDTYLANLPSDQIRAKLESVYSSFVREGFRPTSFRGGRYSSGGMIHAWLRDHGFLVDSSIVPYSTWPSEGAPNYRDRELRPTRLPPRSADDHAFWEVPLTLGFSKGPFSFWGKCYNAIEYSNLSKLRLIGMAEKLGVVRKVWLNFEEPLGQKMVPFLYQLRQKQLPCICFTVHSSSLMAGGNPYTPTLADEHRIFAQIEEVLGLLRQWSDFEPATMTEIALRMEKEHHARLGY